MWSAGRRRRRSASCQSTTSVRASRHVWSASAPTTPADAGGLETFQIAERTRLWDAQLAKEHLGLLYERQFKKLAGKDWQEAFTTTEERRQAERVFSVCTRKAPNVTDIQEVVLDLLDTIAKGFGLRKKPNTERRLQAFISHRTTISALTPTSAPAGSPVTIHSAA